MSLVSLISSEPLKNAGGKADGLQRLIRLGLPVPPAFVIAAPASSGGMTPELTEAIRTSLATIGAGPYAVRSSALGEDGETHSFAGQHETVLDVADLPGVLKAVETCWASARSERATAYRAAAGEAASPMAVVVQRMVRADAAGVVFTRNPAGTDGSLIIEAVAGLGEKLVSGAAPPDRFVIDRATQTIRSRHLEANAPIDDALLARLAAMALRVEQEAGTPQDLEWAVERGELFLLQARPITTLAPQPSGPKYVWSNTNTGELLPDVVTPMAFEIVDWYVKGLVAPLFEAVGIDLGDAPIGGRVAGRVYFCLNTMVAVMQAIPGLRRKSMADLFGGDAEQMRLAMESIRSETAPPVRFSFWNAFVGVPRLLFTMARFSSGQAPEAFQRAQARTRELGAVPVASLSDEALVARFHALMAEVFTDLRECFFAVMAGSGFVGLANILAQRWLNDQNGAIASTLFSGMGGVDSAEAGLDLWRVAVLLRRPELLAVAREAPTFEEARKRFESLESGRAFLARWDAFLRDHGHHARGEIDVFVPRWRDDQTGLLQTARAMAEGPAHVDPEAVHRRRTTEREALERDRIGALDPIRRALFRFVLVRAQRGLALRENVKSEGVRRIALTRDTLRALGQRLVARGTLDTAEDVFFLTPNDLTPALAGGALWRTRVIAARRDFVRDRTLSPPPLVIGTFDPASARPPPPPTARVLRGLAVSPGVVEGRARVILSADAHQRLEPGEILVAPFTDPGWAPYFVAASGLVVDMGGMLSHGSIVAREYGLPAVVNVGPATRTIQTGQRLRVDGHSGEVTLLD